MCIDGIIVCIPSLILFYVRGIRGIRNGLLLTQAGGLYPKSNGCESKFPRIDRDFDLNDVLFAIDRCPRTDLSRSAHPHTGSTPHSS
jgi:hypothetical protein